MRWFYGLALATLANAHECCTAKRDNGDSASTSAAAQSLIDRGILALGGLENMANITTMTYVGGDIYRSKSMLETFGLVGVDIAFSSAGSQNISFSFEDSFVKQRIDRSHQLGSYWSFTRPTLPPMDFSVVVHGGDEGFASVVRGSNVLFAPGALPSGFTDGILASYLIREANRMSPLLLLEIMSNNKSSARQEIIDSHTSLPAVYDDHLGLSVIFDPATDLPYIIRSHEGHGILGNSTLNLVLQNYTTVSGVKFPTRFKSVYNDHMVIMEYTVRDILLNTVVNATFDAPGDRKPENSPATSTLYTSTEVGEYYESALWLGRYRGTFEQIRAFNPSPDLSGLWVLVFQDYDNYRQIVYEFKDHVIVVDCPPHQSLLVTRWVKEKLRKRIKYIWPSHHHHDHTWGITDYVQAGAKVLTLDFAREYYGAVPQNKFVTYTTKRPFMVQEGNMQLSFVHMERSVHASDYSYAFATTKCPTANSAVVVFDADDYNPIVGLASGEHFELTQALHAMAQDGVPKNAIWQPAHGEAVPLHTLATTVGYTYPELTTLDFKYLQKC